MGRDNRDRESRTQLATLAPIRGAGEPDGRMSVEEAAEYLWRLFVGQIH